MSARVLVIDPRDNVAVALRDLTGGEMLRLPDGRELTLLTNIPFGHKVALAEIACGEDIIKYGETIGEAKTAIRKGEWIHTHNLNIEEKS